MLYKNRHGFSIVEMLVVIAILGVLVMVGLISYGGMSSTSKTTQCQDNMRGIRNQLRTYFLRNHQYPKDKAQFSDFLDNINPDNKPLGSYFVEKPACSEEGGTDNYIYEVPIDIYDGAQIPTITCKKHNSPY